MMRDLCFTLKGYHIEKIIPLMIKTKRNFYGVFMEHFVPLLLFEIEKKEVTNIFSFLAKEFAFMESMVIFH